ncbi:hypothetical protein NC651_038606 [Populus alba x Populus x berolinensis]|nr:hypothetical protein NC651_038606 [Populus alba x Populus x berolinensis]
MVKEYDQSIIQTTCSLHLGCQSVACSSRHFLVRFYLSLATGAREGATMVSNPNERDDRCKAFSHRKGKDELRTKRRKTRGLRAIRENQRTNGDNEKNRENPRTEHSRGTKHTEHTGRGRTNEKNPGKTETTGHRGDEQKLDQRPQTKPQTQEQR